MLAVSYLLSRYLSLKYSIHVVCYPFIIDTAVDKSLGSFLRNDLDLDRSCHYGQILIFKSVRSKDNDLVKLPSCL